MLDPMYKDFTEKQIAMVTFTDIGIEHAVLLNKAVKNVQNNSEV